MKTLKVAFRLLLIFVNISLNVCYRVILHIRLQFLIVSQLPLEMPQLST